MWLVWLWLFITASLVHANEPQPIRINSGGTSFTDNEGNVWDSDQYYTSGNSQTLEQDIGDTLYQTERRASDAIVYNIPLAQSGWYLVKCHFASGITKRLFGIKMENEWIWQYLNIVQETGDEPLIKSQVVQVTDTTLTLELVKQGDDDESFAAISGIEVLPTMSNLYIDAGSDEAYTDDEGRTWQADQYYNTGLVWSIQRNIAGTNNTRLYQTERYDVLENPSLAYTIPVPSQGMYYVSLHFSDNYKANHEVGKRVFGIKLQGQIVVQDLDLFQEAGAGFTAVVKSWAVQVDDDEFIAIEFIHKTEKPTIAGLEVHGILTSLPETTTSGQSDGTYTTSLQNSDFTPLYINAGSDVSVHDGVNIWDPDKYYFGGQTSNTGRAISGTPFGKLYQTSRFGTSFEYEIDVPAGSYRATLHFAETFEDSQQNGARIFYVYIEGVLILNALDIYKNVGGYASYVVDVPTPVRDGAISIEFVSHVGTATVSAIEIHALDSTDTVGEFEPHYAHAVPGGPYFQVDTDNDGKETVWVDGRFSHTHLPNAHLVRWSWIVNGIVVGTNNEITSLELPVGVHDVTLEVEDTGGYSSLDYTKVTVRAFGYPDIAWIWPEMGDVAGGEKLEIGGSGFTYSSENMTIYIGSKALSYSDIIVVSDEKIEVKSLPSGSAGIVDISVKTPVGASTPVPYTYIDNNLPPIKFTSGFVDGIKSPTCLAFGPDGRLYIGTQLGRIVRLTLDERYQIIEKFVSSVVTDSAEENRVILGIAFDPTDVSADPTVYVSHSWLFHQQVRPRKHGFTLLSLILTLPRLGQLRSLNGKVSAVSGPNLDQFRHVVTGLPVSDHDHGVNGLVFGDNGELYIQVPGNTNAGIPGSLSSTREQVSPERHLNGQN